MTGINMARVLIGGVVAGLVINIGEFVLNMFVIQAEMDAAIARMNLPPLPASRSAPRGAGLRARSHGGCMPRSGRAWRRVGTALARRHGLVLSYAPSVGMVSWVCSPRGRLCWRLCGAVDAGLRGAGAWLHQSSRGARRREA
jgi:hypothetical protein